MAIGLLDVGKIRKVFYVHRFLPADLGYSIGY